MDASQCSFEQMMIAAAGSFTLAEATSFIQVEYGLNELKACWDGFVHTSDAYGQTFKSRKQICAEFTDALSEYIEFLGESIHLEVGP
jgi:hypothetical protein